MEIFHERCAGLDVHKEVIYICVLIGQGRSSQKFKFRFGTFHHQLDQMRQKLVELGVSHVLMESTGVYWMPIYDALEGFVQIVVGNAQHIMNVPGRKTDETDAEWLAKLLRHGLVKPSFVPERQFRELRQLTRYRRAVVQTRASEQNRVEKHLQIAGVKLSSVASHLFGVSGTNMLNSIAEGTTDPTRLSELALGRLRKKIPQLREAFTGSISKHTQELIATQMDQMNRLECTIAQVELKIDEKVKPYAELLAQLDQIPGIDLCCATDVLAEIGIDMAPWATHRQIAAMSGLCPGNYISAGKRLKNRSRQGNPYLKSILVQAASSAINTNGSYYQSKFRRLKQRRGHKRALVAIAHAMLVTIYYMIKKGEPYRELGANFVTDYENGRKKNDLVKQLQKLGYSVSLSEIA
ncbi:MAG: IS110 family RNA-guided transposase [Thermoanaerobaculia bacterium]